MERLLNLFKGVGKNDSVNIDGSDLDFLVGLKIVAIEEDSDGYVLGYKITLSDGTQFRILENYGCGGCYNGWSELPKLTSIIKLDHAIMNVIVDYNKYNEDEFTVFIYYHDEVYEGKGSDGYGNGYYGGGFHLTLIPVE